jgi:hypothetical protein
MGSIERIAIAIVIVGGITAAFLPGRQTVPGIKAIGGVFQGGLRTAITGK